VTADLEAIRKRDTDSGNTWFVGPASFTAQAARDRRELLALIDELTRQRDGYLHEAGDQERRANDLMLERDCASRETDELRDAVRGKPIHDAGERLPTHNYSVLALITDGPLTLGPDDSYWDICAYIATNTDAPGWVVGDVDDDGEPKDFPVKVSHWCELPWYPEDGEEPRK
jgi:hypothetical protein